MKTFVKFFYFSSFFILLKSASLPRTTMLEDIPTEDQMIEEENQHDEAVEELHQQHAQFPEAHEHLKESPKVLEADVPKDDSEKGIHIEQLPNVIEHPISESEVMQDEAKSNTEDLESEAEEGLQQHVADQEETVPSEDITQKEGFEELLEQSSALHEGIVDEVQHVGEVNEEIDHTLESTNSEHETTEIAPDVNELESAVSDEVTEVFLQTSESDESHAEQLNTEVGEEPGTQEEENHEPVVPDRLTEHIDIESPTETPVEIAEQSDIELNSNLDSEVSNDQMSNEDFNAESEVQVAENTIKEAETDSDFNSVTISSDRVSSPVGEAAAMHDDIHLTIEQPLEQMEEEKFDPIADENGNDVIKMTDNIDQIESPDQQLETTFEQIEKQNGDTRGSTKSVEQKEPEKTLETNSYEEKVVEKDTSATIEGNKELEIGIDESKADHEVNRNISSKQMENDLEKQETPEYNIDPTADGTVNVIQMNNNMEILVDKAEPYDQEPETTQEQSTAGHIENQNGDTSVTKSVEQKEAEETFKTNSYEEKVVEEDTSTTIEGNIGLEIGIDENKADDEVNIDIPSKQMEHDLEKQETPEYNIDPTTDEKVNVIQMNNMGMLVDKAEPHDQEPETIQEQSIAEHIEKENGDTSATKSVEQKEVEETFKTNSYEEKIVEEDTSTTIERNIGLEIGIDENKADDEVNIDIPSKQMEHDLEKQESPEYNIDPSADEKVNVIRMNNNMEIFVDQVEPYDQEPETTQQQTTVEHSVQQKEVEKEFETNIDEVEVIEKDTSRTVEENNELEIGKHDNKADTNISSKQVNNDVEKEETLRYNINPIVLIDEVKSPDQAHETTQAQSTDEHIERQSGDTDESKFVQQRDRTFKASIEEKVVDKYTSTAFERNAVLEIGKQDNKVHEVDIDISSKQAEDDFEKQESLEYNIESDERVSGNKLQIDDPLKVLIDRFRLKQRQHQLTRRYLYRADQKQKYYGPAKKKTEIKQENKLETCEAGLQHQPVDERCENDMKSNEFDMPNRDEPNSLKDDIEVDATSKEPNKSASAAVSVGAAVEWSPLDYIIALLIVIHKFNVGYF